MADYSKTVTNTIEVFGGGQSTKWNEFTWDDYVWGEGTLGIPFTYLKNIYETQVMTDNYDLYAQFNINKSNTISMTIEPSNEMISQGVWELEFTAPSTNAENRSLTTWTEV
jgi:hypothetical protein